MLDPRSVQSDVLDRLKKLQPSYEAPQLPSFEFEDTTLFDSHRGLLRFIRRLLNPILKLFFNPNPLIGALHTQSRLNAMYADREAKRDAMRLAGEQLYYQVLQNLLLEMSRTAIEVKSLRMRLESIGSRLEFNERRARDLESAIAFPASIEKGPDRPARVAAPITPAAQPHVPQPAGARRVRQCAPQGGQGQPADGAAQRSRRRRRRRGRRGGGGPVPTTAGVAATPGGAPADAAAPEMTSAKDDLENFGGAAAHPSEPEIPPPARPPDADDPVNPGRHLMSSVTPACDDGQVKIAVIVQRYGESINGGAELHARYIAEHLARHADVEVLTTCATDYVTWRNDLRAR